MKLGAFSVGMSVKEINISKDFYEKLGFSAIAGDLKENYLIMKNENAVIGLFQGMFEGNILVFNPGWDQEGKEIKDFTDIFTLQKKLKQLGVKITKEIDTTSTSEKSFMTADPDGNTILFDQHC